MNTQKQRLMYVVLCALLCAFPQISAAQDGGEIETSAADNGGLPPGAVYENGVILHPISSAEENLHLLAGYYYRNPREWKRIYKDNRNVIRNPNTLPVGQTLKIQVGENWKPVFSYEEWFRQANRNGQWKSGQPWKPARASSGTMAAPPAAAPMKSESKQATPAPAPKPKTEPKAPKESPPAKTQPAPAKDAPEEVPEPEKSPEPEESDEGVEEEQEEAAPAF